MPKFETGKKYYIYDCGIDKKIMGVIEVLSRSPKFITYHDTFFNRTEKKKIVVRDNQESIFAFYRGVYAADVVTG